MAAAFVGLGGLVGCASYINYPPVGDDWAINNTNVNPSHAVMEAAMLRALRRSGAPADLGYEAYVVNPPRGTDLRHAQALADRLNAVPGFEGAQVVTPDNGHLPAFHITRVWVRGDSAIVDVLRPIHTVRPVQGQSEVFQPYTVWLRGGGGQQWRTTATRDWPVGMEAPPDRWTWRTQFPQPPIEPGEELRPRTAPEPVRERIREFEPVGEPEPAPGAPLEFDVQIVPEPAEPGQGADAAASGAVDPGARSISQIIAIHAIQSEGPRP